MLQQSLLAMLGLAMIGRAEGPVEAFARKSRLRPARNERCGPASIAGGRAQSESPAEDSGQRRHARRRLPARQYRIPTMIGMLTHPGASQRRAGRINVAAVGATAASD